MDRLKYYCKALKIQDGTIQQISAITGCSVNDLLHASPANTHTGSNFNLGLYWDTNGEEHKEKVLLPSMRGNIDYWLGVIHGIELTEVTNA